MKKTVLLFFTIFLSNRILAQTKVAITHETMWLMKRVGSPEVSPDGKWVIYTVSEPSYTEADQISDLWISPTDGSIKPRRLTTGKSGESGYRWSPDGKQIAFAAKREGDENAQIYILNFGEGGEAQRFTNLSTGASAPQWSPDGKRLLFTSNVFPGAFTDSLNKKIAEDRKKLKYKARVYTSYPIRNFDHWNDDKQTHVFIQSMEQDSIARDAFSQTVLVSKEGFNFGNAIWSANSKEIIFSAMTDFNTSAYQDPTTNLYKVSVHGGDATQLTNDGNDYNNVQTTIDGKYLICYATANNNYKVYNINKLTRFDYPSMQNKTLLTPLLDRPINNFTIKNNMVFLSVEDQGNDKLYSILVGGGNLTLLSNIAIGCYTSPSVSTDGQTILSSYETASAPPEIVILKNGSPMLVTSFNTDKVKSLDMPPVETIWTMSNRGKKYVA